MKAYNFTFEGDYLGGVIIVTAPTYLKAKNHAVKEVEAKGYKLTEDDISLGIKMEVDKKKATTLYFYDGDY